MRKVAKIRSNRNLARAAAWARLWLACVAALLNWTSGFQLAAPKQREGGPALSKQLQRRLPILDLPLRVLARFVLCLSFLQAIARAPKQARRAGSLRAILRAGARFLKDANGYSLAAIARAAVNPEPIIKAMLTALTRGQPRRTPILRRKNTDEALARVTRALTCANADTS